jgi:peptidoglycan hydrolase CwlO-like protein
MDKKTSDLQNSLDSMNRAVNLLQRNVENHRQSIAADQTEMERFNAEVERLDHVIADMMRRR